MKSPCASWPTPLSPMQEGVPVASSQQVVVHASAKLVTAPAVICGPPLHLKWHVVEGISLSLLLGRDFALEHGIVVRNALEGETLRALDGSELKLRTHDLVIADAAKVVALAGVMGGVETGVTSATTDLLLESAWFEPSRVRKSSRELGLSTDSSYRFERRVDPAGVLPASARAEDIWASLPAPRKP